MASRRTRLRITRELTRHGFAGLGSSDGDFANANSSSKVDDLVAAADFLRSEYRAPGLLIGHNEEPPHSSWPSATENLRAADSLI